LRYLVVPLHVLYKILSASFYKFYSGLASML